ncbi:HTH domain-containing protein [Methylobacterium sp. PvR107]|uniref:HTH domain-containing protein n=1 Tax=Methylobacterium sp. PvR107 TaxID=2806597 RepID=UPI001AE2CDF1|nr:HTH domain-containing protein [Methylobacterium sp. PvR107]MBP1184106.1 hypothetical protein [Methylobacterium sp. PvR107]
MSLSESAIVARLAALRSQREALDREIADLVLYLELGRRLSAAGTISDPSPQPAPPERDRRDPAPAPGRAPGQAAVGRSDPAALLPFGQATPSLRGPEAPPAVSSAPRSTARSDAPSEFHPEAGRPPGAIPPPVAFTDDAAGARRYGRAVVQAACAAIAQAGRPLHAAEILEVLLKQGFILPGRDPVAALNTRLWKRTGTGGPLCRVGEATYALAAPGAV